MKTNILKLVNWIVNELSTIRKQLDGIKPHSTVSSDWISWKEVMLFFDYKDTQMAEMVVEQKLVVTKVGRRKFIKRTSILTLLENNIVKEIDTNNLTLPNHTQ
jgi:hypothetical protein